jgi:serine O-acetyltransferase
VATVRQDVDRYVFEVERGRSRRTGLVALLRVFVCFPGLWGVMAYRVTHHAFRLRPHRLGYAVGLSAQVFQRLVLALTGIELDHRAHVGPGLMIPHSGFIVVGPARIGRHCTISQGVTIGHSTTEHDPGQWSTPVLGDRIWIGPGAVIAGAIHIGADAVVGANSTLTRDVPDRGVVLGVPARLIGRTGSFAQIAYRGMDDDPERVAALTAGEVTATS